MKEKLDKIIDELDEMRKGLTDPYQIELIEDATADLCALYNALD